MFSPTKMIFFLHLFPVLRIIFNVRVQSTFVRRKSLLKKENKEKKYVKERGRLMKQTEVAKVLGISQVQVSRLEKKILIQMRQNLDFYKSN